MNTKKWIVVLLVMLALLSGAFNYYMESARNSDTAGISTPRFGSDSGDHVIVGRNRPVVLSFIGDLATKGVRHADGTIVPFVADDILKLEAETLHAIEYRWTYDYGAVKDEVIKDKGQEWSRRGEREFDVQEGDYTFKLQLRGADPNEVSIAKETKLKVPPLFIEEFEKNIVHSGDRALPGDEFIVEVRMPKPLGGPIEPYRYRYFVRGDVVKVEGDEWTTEDSLFYKFPEPGNYDFKVQVRREDKKEAEAEAELAETITVADAVLLEFDATPENQASAGTKIQLSTFPFSRFGKSEVRIGAKRITAAGFEWLAGQNGAIWGNSDREWQPTLPGNYLVRAEVREFGKENADDAREFLFTVTEGGF